MTNLDEVFKRRYLTLPTKVCIVKAMVFVIVMYRCQSWITKLSTEELMLSKCGAGKVSWESFGQQGERTNQTIKLKGNQPWIFIGKTDGEAEAPILWPPDAKSWLTGKDLILGKTEGRRRIGPQRVRWLNGITDSVVMNLSKLWELVKDRKPGMLQFMGLQSWTWLSN